jgi:hypothetical protein
MARNLGACNCRAVRRDSDASIYYRMGTHFFWQPLSCRSCVTSRLDCNPYFWPRPRSDARGCAYSPISYAIIFMAPKRCSVTHHTLSWECCYNTGDVSGAMANNLAIYPCAQLDRFSDSCEFVAGSQSFYPACFQTQQQS